ncbi:MAG TPA: hypothetical protein G4O10_11385 [Dehalococcoidia bacterium]|nr:hypothetical protein [Dehalococcoidia bacterium]
MKSPLPSPERLAFAEALAQAGYAQAGAKRGYTPLGTPKRCGASFPAKVVRTLGWTLRLPTEALTT